MLDAFLAWRGGDFNDGDGNNDGRREGLILTRMTTKTPTAMKPWTTTTSFFDTTTNLWSDAFLAWRVGVILLMMMMATTLAGESG